jgi:hypothetical protein
MWGRIIIGLLLAVLLAAALIFAAAGWARAEGLNMSIWGILALVLGSLLTMAIGGGLMALLFYSARKGYDDQVHDFAADITKKPGGPAPEGPANDD